MKKQGWGRIINSESAHGLVASATKFAYVAAKHGVVGLTKVTALENAGNGVTCNAICPGWVRTPLVEKQIEALAQKQGISIDDAAKELLRSEEHTSELQSLMRISYALFCLKKKKTQRTLIDTPRHE